MLRRLAKKHKLSYQKLEKLCIYIEDLVEVLQTNLITTKKTYIYGWHRVQLHLQLQLAYFIANWPQALLDLYYRYIIVILLCNLEGGPYRILLEFTFEFIKQYLRLKDWYIFLQSILYIIFLQTYKCLATPSLSLRSFIIHLLSLVLMPSSWVSSLLTKHLRH